MARFIYFSLRKAALWWLTMEESAARMETRRLREPGTGERFKEGIQVEIMVSLHPYEWLSPNLTGSPWPRKNKKIKSRRNLTLPLVGERALLPPQWCAGKCLTPSSLSLKKPQCVAFTDFCGVNTAANFKLPT